MKRDLDTLLADTLFNTNLRPTTKKSVLLAALKKLKVSADAFSEAIEKETTNPENVQEDLRSRNRNIAGEDLTLEEKELRLLQGKSLNNLS